MFNFVGMAAPKGNNFWELRSKHGRDPLFKTADLMWEAACEYFQWCIDNPIVTVEFMGKDAEERLVPKQRPFTLHGICLYMDCNINYFREFKESELGKTKDFSVVISRIEEIIYNQKYSGAAVGVFNANIIARDLGLAEKNVNETNLSVSEEVLKSIADKLNS